MIIQKYKLNLVHGGEPVTVRASQYDNLTRVITFALFKDRDIFVVPDGCKVYVLGTKEDKTGYFYECTVEHNYVAFYMRQQMTVLAGKHVAEIRIVDEENHILNSANFIVDIEEAAFKDDTIISETDIPLLEEILEHIDAIYSVENLLQGGSEGQVLTKISDEDGDVEWKNLPTIPNKTSELENDSGFITKEVDDLTNYHTSAVQDIIDNSKEDILNKVTSISSESTNEQYPSAKAVYDELNNKVDKEVGKGLSTNDFTNADKNKLDDIESGAEVNVIDDIKVDGETKRALIGEGYIDAMRYKNFVDVLEEKIKANETIFGSVEIIGLKENGNRIKYLNGYQEIGRIPTEYRYSGFAVLGVMPSDETARLIEINNRKGIDTMEKLEKIFEKFEEKFYKTDEYKQELEKKQKENEDLKAQNKFLADKLKENDRLKEELDKLKAKPRI